MSGAATPSRRHRYFTGVVAITVIVALVFSLGAVASVPTLCVLAVVLVLAWTVWWWRRSLPGLASSGQARFEALVELCYGDRDMATRLVAAEGRRAPAGSRRELVDQAIERLRDDRRR